MIRGWQDASVDIDSSFEPSQILCTLMSECPSIIPGVKMMLAGLDLFYVGVDGGS